MNQVKKWANVALYVLMSVSIGITYAQQAPEFKTVSPLMMSQPAAPSDASNANTIPAIQPPPPTGNTSPVSMPVSDPLENMNRKIFTFNDTLDTNVLVPVSKTYNKIMPKPLNRGIYNVFSNLNSFPTISNDLLQGNFYQASSDCWRFVVNSTAGAGGLFDVAKNMGLENNNEDFGLTLARWGYTDSNYLVLPFFGPSTVRDAMGLPVDYLLFSPYGYMVKSSRERYTLYALNIVSKRAQLLQYQDLYNQIALDRYAFIRNAYLQQRESEIDRNQNLGDPYFTLSGKKEHTNSSTS